MDVVDNLEFSYFEFCKLELKKMFNLEKYDIIKLF